MLVYMKTGVRLEFLPIVKFMYNRMIFLACSYMHSDYSDLKQRI